MDKLREDLGTLTSNTNNTGTELNIITNLVTTFENPQKLKSLKRKSLNLTNNESSELDNNKLPKYDTKSSLTREKRVRKQKTFDNEFVLFNNSTAFKSTSSTVNNLTGICMNNENEELFKYNVGDLVWAKISGHPWWPCIVSLSIETLPHTHIKYIGITRPKRMFFVEFFGPSIEHAWVSEGCLIEYKGVEEFKISAQKQVNQAMTKSAKEKLADRFQLKVALSRRDHWEQAVLQADIWLNKDSSERTDYITKKYLPYPQTDPDLETDQTEVDHQMNEKPTALTVAKISDKTNLNKLKKKNSVTLNNKQLQMNTQDSKSIKTKTIEDKKMKFSGQENGESNKDDKIYQLNKNQLNESFENKSKYEYNITENLNNNNNNSKQNYYLEKQHPLLASTFQISNIDLSSFLVDENEEDSFEEDLDHQDEDKKIKCTYKSIEHDQSVSERKFLVNQTDNTKIKKKVKKSSDEEDFDDNELYDEENDSEEFGYNADYVLDKNYSDIEGINCKKQLIRSIIKPNESYIKPENEIKINQNLLDHDNLDINENKVKIKKKNVLPKIVKVANNVKNQNKKDEITDNSIAALVAQVKDEVLEPNSCSLTSDTNNGQGQNSTTAETYLIDRYKYAVRHIRQGLSVEEACNKYRISKGALLKCLSGGTAPRGKKTRLTEFEENEIVEWLINNKDLKYNEAIHLVFEQVEKIFEQARRPNPFHNGKPSMDWWYDFLSRHPQIMASKPEWLRRGKVNDQYIRDVQSGKLRCTKFRRALLSAIQYIRSLSDAAQMAAEIDTEDNTFKHSMFVNYSNQTIVKNESKNLLKKNVDDEKCLQSNTKLKIKTAKTVRISSKTINKQRKKDKNNLKLTGNTIIDNTSNLDKCNDDNLSKTKSRKQYFKIKTRPQMSENDFNLIGSMPNSSIINNLNHDLNRQKNILLDEENSLSTDNHQNYIDKLVASLISDYEDNNGLFSKSVSITNSTSSTSSLDQSNSKLLNNYDFNNNTNNQFNKSIIQHDLINDCYDNNVSENSSKICTDDLVLDHNLAESYLNEKKYHQNYLITNDDEDDENNYESFKGSSYGVPVTSSHLIVADNEDEDEEIDDNQIIDRNHRGFDRKNGYNNCSYNKEDNLNNCIEEYNNYEDIEEDEDENADGDDDDDDDDYDGQTHITTLHEFE